MRVGETATSGMWANMRPNTKPGVTPKSNLGPPGATGGDSKSTTAKRQKARNTHQDVNRRPGAPRNGPDTEAKSPPASRPRSPLGVGPTEAGRRMGVGEWVSSRDQAQGDTPRHRPRTFARSRAVSSAQLVSCQHLLQPLSPAPDRSFQQSWQTAVDGQATGDPDRAPSTCSGPQQLGASGE